MKEFKEVVYNGFTIRATKDNKGFYAFNSKTGDVKGGSSRTFLELTLGEIKRKIDKVINCVGCCI